MLLNVTHFGLPLVVPFIKIDTKLSTSFRPRRYQADRTWGGMLLTCIHTLFRATVKTIFAMSWWVMDCSVASNNSGFRVSVVFGPFSWSIFESKQECMKGLTVHGHMTRVYRWYEQRQINAMISSQVKRTKDR